MDLRISLLSFNFVVINIMQNVLVLIKNQMNLKDRSIIDFYCFFLIIFFHNIQ